MLGLIMLDTTFPRIPGDVGNPETFSFPVRVEKVPGATVDRVVKQSDDSLLAPFVDAARRLEQAGATFIGTSCGFLAMFQQELAEAVKVPVYASSLLQVPLAARSIGPGRRVGVLTAHSERLGERHFQGVGIENIPICIGGMQHSPEFASVFLGGKRELDKDVCCQEMIDAAGRLLRANSEVGALVLECTNMPPYSEAIRKAFGLPVFDVVTMLNMANAVA